MTDTIRTQSELLGFASLSGADFRWTPQDQRDLIVTMFSLGGGGGGTPAWTGITGKPTTIAGYGITDAFTQAAADARYAAAASTLAGYGISDAYTKTASDARYDAAGSSVAWSRITGITGTPNGTKFLRDDGSWQTVAAGGGTITSVFGRSTAAIVAASGDYTFAQLASVPTTIAGYGITDFNSLGDARWSGVAHTHTFASLTSKPTTLSGFGITDGITATAAAATYAPIAVPFASITGVPAYALIASPTFTGTPAAPTAAAFTSSTQIATTAFVTSQIDAQAPYDTGTGGSVTITRTAARVTQKRVLNANATLTIDQTAIPTGGYLLLDTYQDGTGGWTRALALASGSITWVAGGGAPAFPTTPTNGDRVVIYNAGGGVFQGWQAWRTDAVTSSGVTSVFGRSTSAIVAASGDYTFAQIGSTPTTIGGYGITDAYTKTAADARYAPIAVPWGSLTSVPTTISGYGITDAYTKTASDARYDPIGAASPAFVTLTDGGTITWATGGAPVLNATVTLGGNRTLAITGAVSGASGVLIVKQPSSGGPWALTLPTGSKVVNSGAGAVSLSSTASAIDVLSFVYDGTNYLWTYGKAFT